MKRAVIVFSVMASLLLPGGCGGPKKDAVLDYSYPEFDASSFTQSNQCQYCHYEIFTQWQWSAHSLSHRNSFYLSERAQNESGGNKKFSTFCDYCHTPVAALAGLSPADPALSGPATEGIGCDFCHVVTGSAGPGNARYHLSPGRVKYGPFEDPLPTPFHDSRYAEIFKKADYCGICHQANHPQNNLPLSSTYREWKESSLANRRIECQDCHMTPGPGVARPNPGVAATGAPKKREHVSTHFFTGSNVYLAEQAGKAAQASLAREQLRAAAELFLSLPEYFLPYQPVQISVRVRNSGAGHYLPTGFTMFKEMWLEVTVTDHQGRKIYESGTLDSEGRLKQGSVVYTTVLGDSAGSPTLNIREATSVLSDRRIPPQQYLDEYFEIPQAPDRGPLNVQVRLLYRGISAPFAARLPGVSLPDIPVVEMAAITGRIELK